MWMQLFFVLICWHHVLWANMINDLLFLYADCTWWPLLSQIQSISDGSRGSIRRKSRSSPQCMGQDVNNQLPNDTQEEEVEITLCGCSFPITTLRVPLYIIAILIAAVDLFF